MDSVVIKFCETWLISHSYKHALNYQVVCIVRTLVDGEKYFIMINNKSDISQ